MRNSVIAYENQIIVDDLICGRLDRYEVILNNGNFDLFLKTTDDNIPICIDNKKNTCYDYHYYNNGKFPYVVKDELKFYVFIGQSNACVAYIKSFKIVADNIIKSHINGKFDSCDWKIVFELYPCECENLVFCKDNNNKVNKRIQRVKSNVYLIIWKTEDNKITEEDYNDIYLSRYTFNWSFKKPTNIQKGDKFFMMKIDGKKTYITAFGEFVTDPKGIINSNFYTNDLLFTSIRCEDMIPLFGKSPLPLEKLLELFPSINWDNCYNGMSIPNDVANELLIIWNNKYD